ncbi:hypothetical protein FRB97_009453 [Tulasnella sp. 331]|nr:hypothetical protein FRB97_009453 [Tulasnella sp. 331]
MQSQSNRPIALSKLKKRQTIKDKFNGLKAALSQTPPVVRGLSKLWEGFNDSITAFDIEGDRPAQWLSVLDTGCIPSVLDLLSVTIDLDFNGRITAIAAMSYDALVGRANMALDQLPAAQRRATVSFLHLAFDIIPPAIEKWWIGSRRFHISWVDEGRLSVIGLAFANVMQRILTEIRPTLPHPHNSESKPPPCVAVCEFLLVYGLYADPTNSNTDIVNHMMKLGIHFGVTETAWESTSGDAATWPTAYGLVETRPVLFEERIVLLLGGGYGGDLPFPTALRFIDWLDGSSLGTKLMDGDILQTLIVSYWKYLSQGVTISDIDQASVLTFSAVM